MYTFPVEDDSALIGENVRKLLESSGIEKTSHAKELAAIVGVSRPQAYKLLNGTSRWDREKIGRIAVHFKVSTTQIDQPPSTGHKVTVSLRGELSIAGRNFPCNFGRAEKVTSGLTLEWVCYEQDNKWFVVEGTIAPSHTNLYRVNRLEIIVARTPTVAVLDDDPNAADQVAAGLNEFGFQATSFYAVPTFIEALDAFAFDCFVLDWEVGARTSEDAMRAIRAKSPRAPILLLTGRLTGELAENSIDTQVSLAMKTYHVRCREKPWKPHILASELQTALEEA